MKLEPYSAEIRLPNLTPGVDNIHYDVFLSPRFVDFTKKYLQDLVRQSVNVSLFYGKDRKQSGAPEHERVPLASDRSSASLRPLAPSFSNQLKAFIFCTASSR